MKSSYDDDYIEMAHGSGGRATAQLIDDLFIKAFNNTLLNEKNDAASFSTQAGEMVITTDAHVISPLFFPGGNIGSLAIHGTVNDIAMAGGIPQYITCSFILEEGFPLKELKNIVDAMAQAAKEAEIKIVSGDTKVVEKGKGDGVFITTTGVGVKYDKARLSPLNIQEGDQIIINGSLGDHGISILSLRDNLGFHTSLQSDSASLHQLTKTLLDNFAGNIHCLRDPTRGGIAATLNELAEQSQQGMLLNENALPIKPEVKAACELLGLDPLHIANEGKLVCFCDKDVANDIVKLMRKHPLGQEAAIIGEAVNDKHQLVELKTLYGGKRIVDWLHGDQLPRIC